MQLWVKVTSGMKPGRLLFWACWTEPGFDTKGSDRSSLLWSSRSLSATITLSLIGDYFSSSIIFNLQALKSYNIQMASVSCGALFLFLLFGSLNIIFWLPHRTHTLNIHISCGTYSVEHPHSFLTYQTFYPAGNFPWENGWLFKKWLSGSLSR